MSKHAAAGQFRPGLVVALLLLHLGACIGVVRMIQHGVASDVLAWAATLYMISSIGVTAGYHRFWTHRSYRSHPVVQGFLAVLGALALEGPIIKWYKDHHQHHAYTDRDGDPHSPVVDSFWWAHMGWLFYDVEAPQGYRRATFFDKDPIVRWQYYLYWPLAITLGFILPLLATGDPDAVWIAGFLRVTLHLHATWSVNSVCHRWGRPPRDRNGKPLRRRDRSVDNWVVALLSSGEGWHATHHADPDSYDLGVWWWRYDLGKWCIDLCAFLNLVTDRKGYAPS